MRNVNDIERIYQKYFHDVFLYIRAMSGNESLAEEIAQETFVRAMESLHQFDGSKDIRAWLFTIAKNLYRRHCRRNRIYTDEANLESIEDSSPQILEKIVSRETAFQIVRNAEKLPEPYRQVLRLRIYGELSFEKIGQCFGKSAGWARVTCYRARQMIRKELSREESSNERNQL